MSSSESTILAVFDPEAEEERSNFGLMNFQSTLLDMDVLLLHEQFFIPPEFQLEVPESNDRVCKPPLLWMNLYEKCFRARLKLPLHPFFTFLFRFLNMSPCLIVPNSWWHICRFTAVCVLAGVNPSTTLFLYLHTFKNILDHISGGTCRLRKGRGRTPARRSKTPLLWFMVGKSAYLCLKCPMKIRVSSIGTIPGNPFSGYQHLIVVRGKNLRPCIALIS